MPAAHPTPPPRRAVGGRDPAPPGPGSRGAATTQLAGIVDALVRSAVPEADPGTVSVWAGDLDGEPWFTRHEDVPHYAASTMKLPLLVAACRRHLRGEIDLDQPIPVHNSFASAVDGSRFSLDQEDDQDDDTWVLLGGQAPTRWLVRHAIVRSGNLATNLVLEQVGVQEVSAVLADAGCSARTSLPRGIGDALAREAGLDNTVTAADLGRIMVGIAGHTLAPPRSCGHIEAVLAAQEHREMIPAGLPEGTYVANKTGWVDGVTHDVALVRPQQALPYALAVCTTVDVPEGTAHELVAGISRAVWQERVG